MANRAAAVVMRVLAPLGRVRPDPRSAALGLVLDGAGHRFRFDVLWAGEGFPEDVRRVLSPVAEASGRPGHPGSVTVVAARRFSTGAQRLLRDHDLSWADESGAAHIVAAPGLLIDRRSERPTARPPTPRRAWSTSSAAIAEVLLADAIRTGAAAASAPATLTTATALARRAGVSVSLVNATLRGWQAEGWVDKRGGQRGPTSTRLLVGAGELLSSWAAWVVAQPVRELPVAATFSNAIAWAQTQLPSVMPRGDNWCLGGPVASELQAPAGTPVSRVLCHVSDDVFDLLCESLDHRGTTPAAASGASLLLRAAPRVTVALAGPGPVPLASPPRVYADLVAELGPGHDAAAHFRSLACGC